MAIIELVYKPKGHYNDFYDWMERFIGVQNVDWVIESYDLSTYHLTVYDETKETWARLRWT